MSSFLGLGSGSSAAQPSPPGQFFCEDATAVNSESVTFSTDMVARKEAVMNNIRGEMALVNAQQLMNVRG